MVNGNPLVKTGKLWTETLVKYPQEVATAKRKMQVVITLTCWLPYSYIIIRLRGCDPLNLYFSGYADGN